MSCGKQLIVAVYPELNLKIEDKSIIAADYITQKQMVHPLLSQRLTVGDVW